MTRRLLDYFFSRETLARSSATGQRIAHNTTTMERPLRLPVAVVNAIKGRREQGGMGSSVPSRCRIGHGGGSGKANGATRERGRVPLCPTEYVTKMCGRGCNFNAVINSKCGTSRRAVKKMVVKM